MTIYTITAGHSFLDPGAVAADGQREEDLMTELRDIIASKLRKMGHTVRTDGGWRRNLPLVNAIALVPGAAVAIELHMNASTNASAFGVEVVSLPSRAPLARSIARRTAHVIDSRTRGAGGWIDQSQTARGRLGFVRAGGLVVEVGFISNPAELHLVRARLWGIASAIVAALTEPAP